MSSVAVTLLKPRFSIDYTGVRRDDAGDFLREDLGPLLGQEIFIDSAIKLRDLAAAPTLIFAPSPGSLRSIAARFRLSGAAAAHVDDGVDVETARNLARDLRAGRLDALATINRLAGSTAIPNVHSIAIMRPTLRAEVQQRFISRLDTSAGAVTIIDMVDNIGRFPLPSEWNVTTITEPPTEILRDPMLTKLVDVPDRSAKAWAGANAERIELVRKAKGHRLGWSFHVLQAAAGKDAAERWWHSRKSS